MDNEYVTEVVCTERHKNADDRFARDKERLDKAETHQAEQDERTQKIETLIVQTSEILKNHDAKIENHDQRIGALESKPGKSWENFKNLLIGALTTGLVTAILAFVFK